MPLCSLLETVKLVPLILTSIGISVMLIALLTSTLTLVFVAGLVISLVPLASKWLVRSVLPVLVPELLQWVYLQQDHVHVQLDICKRIQLVLIAILATILALLV